jgi:uncharacterized membrane protein YhaH (DUF805 family)
MKWFLKCVTDYGTFEGRSRRKEYWTFVLLLVIISAVTVLIDLFIINKFLLRDNTVPILTWIFLEAMILPILAVTMRRLHDINRSAWWIFGATTAIWAYLISMIFVKLDNVISDGGASMYVLFSIYGLALLFSLYCNIRIVIFTLRGSQHSINKFGNDPTVSTTKDMSAIQVA